MKQLAIVLHVCLFGFCPLLSQNPEAKSFNTNDRETIKQSVASAQSALDSGKYQIALDQSLRLMEQISADNRSIGAELFSNQIALIAITSYSRLEKLERTIPFPQKASLQSGPEVGTTNATNLYFLALCHQQLGEFESAVYFHEKALKARQALLGESHPDVMASLMACGKAYLDWGDAGKAIDFYKKGLLACQKRYGDEQKESAVALLNLGAAYYSNNDMPEAERCFSTALAIQLKVLPDTIDYDVSRAYNHLGRIALVQKNFDLAIQRFEKAENIRLKLYPSDHHELLAVYNNLGIGWKNKRQFAMAESFFLKALDIRKKFLPPGHPDLATPYFNLGACYQLKQDWPRSIMYFDTALVLLKGALSPEHPFIAETWLYIGNVYTSWAQATDSAPLLQKARDAFKNSWEILLAQQKWTKNKTSKKEFVSQLLTVCEQNIHAGLQTWGQEPLLDQETLWSFSESAKSYLLLEGISEEYALHYSGIPDSLLRREQQLRTAITDQKKRLQRRLTEGFSKTNEAVLEIDGLLVDLNLSYDSLKSTFERDFPNYFQLKYNQNSLSIAHTQAMLSSRQTLLEFFTGDNSIYIFILHRDFFKIIEVKRDFPLADWVKKMREGICGYYTAASKTPQLYEQTVKDYTSSSQNLYKKLLEPVQQWLTEELIIVPDAELNNLPFDALLTGVPEDLRNFSSYPFLIKTKTVHYGYSATMLHQMITQKPRKQPVANLLAFAPFFHGDTLQFTAQLSQKLDLRKGFQPLPYSGEEVFRVRNELGQSAAIFTGDLASRQKFIDIAGDYKILHLATHGKANPDAGDFSFLAFAPGNDSTDNGLLYVGDLYNVKLNAEMVVLSACETGLGELQRGEGVVSLARAFAYAGAKSIVTSLWSVSDKAMMQLMSGFYHELGNENPKNIALAASKRAYLNTNPGRQSHPFFWAGIVAVGDMAPIK